MVKVPNFVHTMENEGELLRQYADVYASELREGGTVFELTENGEFSIFELWYSPTKKEFNLVPVETYRVSAGLHQGKPALLAGELHLLELSGDKIVLHGVSYQRYGKKLSSLGDVLESRF